MENEPMARLPKEFSDLQAFVAEFAIADDLVWQSNEQSADLALRRQFVAALWPKMQSINAYLDVHDDEPAHLLGRLAEAACEVAIELGQPTST